MWMTDGGSVIIAHEFLLLLPTSAKGLVQLNKASVFVTARGSERQFSRIE